jgi:hypothetical protein
MTRDELDHAAATVILYDWACANISTARAKAACENIGFCIDFRQADLGAYIEAEYHGKFIQIEI